MQIQIFISIYVLVLPDRGVCWVVDRQIGITMGDLGFSIKFWKMDFIHSGMLPLSFFHGFSECSEFEIGASFLIVLI
jgi:hypothetical protein